MIFMESNGASRSWRLSVACQHRQGIVAIGVCGLAVVLGWEVHGRPDKTCRGSPLWRTRDAPVAMSAKTKCGTHSEGPLKKEADLFAQSRQAMSDVRLGTSADSTLKGGGSGSR